MNHRWTSFGDLECYKLASTITEYHYKITDKVFNYHSKHQARCQQRRLNTLWKSGKFTRKSEITLRDHFTQAMWVVRHTLYLLFTLDYNVVSHGQTLFSRRGVIACSISARAKKGPVWFTDVTYFWRLHKFGGVNRSTSLTYCFISCLVSALCYEDGKNL